jgi:bifunctional pyridoxal-dependent enzyme with beta-cystathionase and maltose regulon repressor activities
VSNIADDQDGILVARPFYNGFQTSFEGRNGVKAVGVELEAGTEASPEALKAFERELEASEARGVKIRAVMICNPNNPLGGLR